jgi:membrane protease YdiL (CAAX protease family)
LAEGNERPNEGGPAPGGAALPPRVGALQAVAESLLALLAASTLTLMLTAPLLPTAVECTIPLRAGADGEVVAPEEVRERVLALGLAESAEVVFKDGSNHLVLHEVGEPETLDVALGPLLRSSGYVERESERRQVFSLDALLDLDPRTLPALMSIQALTFLLIGALLIRLRARRAPGPRGSAARAFVIGVLGGGAAVVASAAISIGLEAIGIPVEEQAWLARLFEDPVALAWLAPWIVLIGPLSEEVFFRRYAFRVIAERAGLPAGLVVSSAMFAAIHLNPSGFLVYLAIGVILGWVYERTGRLLAPIAGHVTLNTVVLVGALFPGTGLS